VWNRAFVYRTLDQKVFWLTRRLAALHIDRVKYDTLFGTDALDDFGEEIAACRDAGLLTVTADAVRPTPLGMFFADSVAAVVASRAIRMYRDSGPATIGTDAPKELLHDARENSNRLMHM
jgi:oxygen-independent coproporphyrinogen-3 oxidase